MTLAPSLALLLAAAALLVAPGPAAPRSRLSTLRGATAAEPGAAPSPPARWLPPLAAAACGLATAVLAGGPTGLIGAAAVGTAVLLGTRRLQRGPARPATVEPLVLAGGWDLLAACLRAGLPVPPAVRAVAVGLPDPAGTALRRAAELLALGAAAEQAWEPALACPDTARMARVARRSGRSGTALATALAALAAEARAGARERSEARAQRAGVLITGPLGLCFLPAFLLIGVVPVVIGLASRLVSQW
ncbi:MAG: type II secretion system protein [Pseudonocardiaceae bacterium]|nr:type II secretion system protein [Pseudonocardiaceae bacterium]